MNVVLSIAKTTIGEAIRRRVLLVILLIGVLFLVIAPGLQILTPRQERAVLVALILGIIQMTSMLIAIVLTVYMLPNEVDRRTIYTILSKPVHRWQFLLGKYLGAVGALGLMMGLMTITVVLVFALQQGTRDFASIAPIAQAPLMFFFQMSLLAAVGVFFSTFVTPVVNFFLTGGVYLVGMMFNPLFQTIATDKSVLPVGKGAATVIHTIVPNFANYNIQNPIINPGQQIRAEGVYYLELIVYALIYISILLLGGILVFDKREV